MDTIRARIARKVAVSPRQQEIIIGSLLGDGHLAQTTRGFAFRANHSVAQSEYAKWKYRELENLTNSAPNLYKDQSIYFRTVSHGFFDTLRRMFYIGSKKIIPSGIASWITPLSFSVWFMDDGTYDGKQLRINSQSFSKEENEVLISVLEATLGIRATVNRDKNYFRLRIRDKSAPLVRALILKHGIPSMHYKIFP